MKVKVFSARSTRDVAEVLERDINVWLEAHPTAEPKLIERLTHPTFGWGQVILSVFYDES